MKDLTVLQVKALREPGVHRAGKNLYVQIAPGGTKAWLFRYMKDGRARWMGLGSCDLVTLAEAKEKAITCRRRILDGIDPIEHRRGERARAKQEAALAAAQAITFHSCADQYIADHEAGWRNGKHRQQWKNTLDAYVFPVLGDLTVGAVDTDQVLQVIRPLWTSKPETASRVRGRIEVVWDWAKARGYCNGGENPARWRGHLDKLLPAKTKVRAVEHHSALVYDDLPAFMAELREQPGVAARCLEFVILTAVRTGEAIGARWSETDLKTKTWTVPVERMKVKNGKPHVVPLSSRVIEILEAMPRTGDYIFEGARAGRPISNMSMLMLLRRMGRGEITVHGFRSAFRDWTAEKTNYPNHVAEMALAHVVGDKVEAAYRRGDLLKKRRKLMADWARYCGALTGRAS